MDDDKIGVESDWPWNWWDGLDPRERAIYVAGYWIACGFLLGLAAAWAFG